MKKTVLIFVLMCSVFGLKAQCTLPYRPLSSFGTDTTAFIAYNFDARAACYVGKTLKEVMQDLSISVKSYLPTFGPGDGEFPNEDLYGGIYIYIYDYPTLQQFIWFNKDRNTNEVYIEWEIPILSYSLDALNVPRHSLNWNANIANALMNIKIKRVGIIHYRPGKPDCMGIVNGTAVHDICGNCVGGTSTTIPCTIDCAGVANGTAYRDDCGNCVKGTTGKLPCPTPDPDPGSRTPIQLTP